MNDDESPSSQTRLTNQIAELVNTLSQFNPEDAAAALHRYPALAALSSQWLEAAQQTVPPNNHREEPREFQVPPVESDRPPEGEAALLNAIMEAVPVIVWVTHDPQAAVVTGNRLSYEFLRIRRGENLSKSAPEGQSPQHFCVYQNGRELLPEELPLQLAASSGKPVRDFEEEVVFDDGSRFFLLGNVTPLLDESGRPAGAVAAFIDITGRKQVEEALRQAHDRAVWLARFPEENPNPVARVSAEGRVLYRNAVAGKLPGWSLEVDHWLSDPLRSVVTQALTQGKEAQQDIEMAGKAFTVSVMPFPKDRYANIYGREITQRKQAEEALRISEERFNKAFDASPSAMAISRVVDGRILVVNDSFEKLFGYTREEVVGRTSIELDMYADPADRWEMVRRLRAEKIVRDFDVNIRTRSGEIRQASFSVVQLDLGTETNMLTIIQDITERKQAEIALRQTEQHTREILASIRDAFYSLDTQNRFTYVNQIAADLWGRQPEDLIGENIWDVFPSGKETESYQKIQQAVASRQPLRYESYSAYLGQWVDIHLYPTEQGISVYFQDITKRKQAEAALRESEERFRQLADSMPQLVWTARPDGAVDYYNRRRREYDGIDSTPEESWQWAPVLHPDDREVTEAAWQQAVATGEMYQVEHRVRMADGSYRWHLSRGMPVNDSNGQVLRWYGTATDIHAQKMAGQALQDYTEKLQRSNQELEQFAFVASHDLQEPLRKIKLFGNSLEHKLGEHLPKDAQDYLTRMQKAAERMQKMINALLELSRVNTSGGEFEKISLGLVAREAVSDLEARLHASGGHVDVGELPAAEVDTLQIRRLFQNLIGNALKFHKPDFPPLVRISGEVVRAQRQDWVRLAVVDNGIGFDEANAERIFQPFQRLHGINTYEGTGMGLAICQKIVERHHGKIEVRSAPGEGSTFWVMLPVRQKG